MVQLQFHSLDTLAHFNTFLFYQLNHRVTRASTEVQFLEGGYSFLNSLELQAQTAPEGPECRNQCNHAVARTHGYVALSQQIVTVRNRLPAARAEFRQLLSNRNVQERIGLIKGFAVAVHSCDGHSTNPFVSGSYACSGS